MKNRRSVAAEPYAQNQIREITGRGARTTPVITGCRSRSWKIEVCKQKSKPTRRSISNQQQGARQLRSNTNLFVSYVPTRPLAFERQTTTATESATTATTKSHPPKRLLGDKKTPNSYDAIRDECMPLTGFFRGYDLHFVRPSRGAA